MHSPQYIEENKSREQKEEQHLKLQQKQTEKENKTALQFSLY